MKDELGTEIDILYRGDGRGFPTWEAVLRCDPCAYCGARQNITIDHIEPLVGGGRYGYTLNGTAACRKCNGRKGKLTLLEFLNREVWTERVDRPKLPEAPKRGLFSPEQIAILNNYMGARADE
jgi:HNH endonuclease